MREPDPREIRPTVTGWYTVLFAVPRVMMVRPTLGREVEGTTRHRLYRELEPGPVGATQGQR